MGTMSDEAEFVSLCGGLHGRLVGMLTLYTGERELARDLAQETLARLWRDWRRVQRTSSREAYAFRIAINLAKDHFRRMSVRRAHWLRADVDRDAVSHDPDMAAAVAIRQAVAALPHRKRAVLVLRYVVDLSVEDTAAALGIPVNTVKTLARRTLVELRDVLEPQTESEVGDVC
jgi:RNA polymerase sigma factor (sigma-70 family)